MEGECIASQCNTTIYTSRWIQLVLDDGIVLAVHKCESIGLHIDVNPCFTNARSLKAGQLITFDEVKEFLCGKHPFGILHNTLTPFLLIGKSQQPVRRYIKTFTYPNDCIIRGKFPSPFPCYYCLAGIVQHRR